MLQHNRPARVSYPMTTAYLLLRFVWPLLMFYPTGSALAQTPPITPSGLNTQVDLSTSPTVPVDTFQYDITGGTRPGGGPNLFHSFGDFNVPNNNTANFLNKGSFDLNGTLLADGLATSNILARVTNPNPSSIFGTIQTTDFGDASLFLINPAGIVFGPNAALNVGGSINVTTANYIRLFDGVTNASFYANPASDSLATSILAVPPVANFGFMSASPAAYARTARSNMSGPI